MAIPQQPVPRRNVIFVIHPYKYHGTWVFDDPDRGLSKEPFVAGADVVLDRITAHIPEAEHGVTILFSDQPFPGYEHEFVWMRDEFGGAWYTDPRTGQEGWLCSALLRYFPEPPPRLYVQVQPRKS
ncbi:MAG: DUF6717 family protein [Gemmatales bacterium]|nr:hypothetical protein [Gemmatales bacterium]MCS7159775.1 hypothetical protein [Gemmatales bacterium]MDW8174973.1 DUF6717 family protein [Gemmatales bacterium]MDW8221372.1 DUF6717 family protein [Gemmatales bacterium]